MAYEKADVIPPGYYWLDLQRSSDDDVNVVDKDATLEALQQFAWWVKSFSPRIVVVVKAEGSWVLFRVDSPAMRWGVESELGFPTRAPWGMATNKDTIVQRPDPEGIAEFWIREGFELLAKAKESAKDAGVELPDLGSMFGGMGGLLLLYFAAKAFGGK